MHRAVGVMCGLEFDENVDLNDIPLMLEHQLEGLPFLGKCQEFVNLAIDGSQNSVVKDVAFDTFILFILGSNLFELGNVGRRKRGQKVGIGRAVPVVLLGSIIINLDGFVWFCDAAIKVAAESLQSEVVSSSVLIDHPVRSILLKPIKLCNADRVAGRAHNC